jgi:hypothetical protein
MYIKRNLKKRFEGLLNSYDLVAVVGARQAGKTTFLKENLEGSNTNYLTFDDPDVKSLFDDDIKKFENQYLEGYGTVILDEVQYGKEAGRKLKYLADKKRKLWISSSSQMMLSKEVLSWLVGRISIIKLYPFSLNEFLNAKGQKELTQQILKRHVWEHIVYGGYPKVVLAKEVELKKTILKDLYELMVLKDVANTFSIDDISSLEKFSRYLSHSIGDTIIYEKVSSALDLSFQTVKKYLDAMEKSYLIVKVEPFFTNKLKEITKQPKIYFIDSGLRNSIGNIFPLSLENQGKLFENYVLTELIKLDMEVRYWQTKSKAEVDFIAILDGKLIPIEVKIKSGGKVERSLRSFIETYKPREAIVVSYEGEEKETKINDCRIKFTNILGLRSYFQKYKT